MRLRRTGAKKQPRYRVVVADARAPRDGAFVDSIGYYDPLTEPATIRIDQERARQWLDKGVQPSDTVQRLLRRAGIVEGPEPVYPEPKKPARAAAVADEPAPAEGSTATSEEPVGEDESATE